MALIQVDRHAVVPAGSENGSADLNVVEVDGRFGVLFEVVKDGVRVRVLFGTDEADMMALGFAKQSYEAMSRAKLALSRAPSPLVNPNGVRG